MTPPLQRIMANVSPEPNSGCWLWMGAVRGRGPKYGQTWLNGRNEAAHRATWTLLRGGIPDGLVIDHLCRTPLCVNPDHMEVVTPKENTMRGQYALGWRAAANACQKGHVYTEENTRIGSRNGNRRRECRTCNREAAARYALRRAASRHQGPR